MTTSDITATAKKKSPPGVFPTQARRRFRHFLPVIRARQGRW
jgi:hypothetical protein